MTSSANDNDSTATVRVIEYDDMTDAQKRICDAGQRPGIPVPDLGVGPLTAWFLRLAKPWTEMTEEERRTLRFLETADADAFQRWQSGLTETSNATSHT